MLEGGHMERLGRAYLPEEILPHIKAKNRIEIEGKNVKVSSARLHCFKRSLYCASCGIVGTRFYLEKTRKGYGWHLNLYAVCTIGGIDKEVLMTKDHILAKADGGSDHPSNLQTMCCLCNNAKDSCKGRSLRGVKKNDLPKV
jgi:hypothetical protein